MVALDNMTIFLAAVLLLVCSTSGLERQSVYLPNFLPANSLFEDCEPPYIPFKHKCVTVFDNATETGHATDMCVLAGAYADIFESDEERQFVFDELLEGRKANVFLPATGNSTFLVDVYFLFFGFSPTDLTYIKSKVEDHNAPYGIYYNCTVTQDDMACGPENYLPEHFDPDARGYAYCTYARPAYDGPMHQCDRPKKYKFRRDAKRTLRFPNREPDICYVPIKSKRMFRSSMVKIYGFSSSCPTGFLVSRNVNKEIRGDALPQQLKCGNGFGHGVPTMKMRSRRGEELRLYVVLNGDGTPMTIRAKANAF